MMADTAVCHKVKSNWFGGISTHQIWTEQSSFEVR